MRWLAIVVGCLVLSLGGGIGHAQSDRGGDSGQEQQTPSSTGFEPWLETIKQEAEAQGLSSLTVRHALDAVYIDEQVIDLDRKQPERTIAFASYVRGVVDKARIARGRKHLAQNKALLGHVSATYGVPASIIVALWGMESAFGSNVGDFSVVNSLATLAYEGRRASFFKGELFDALRMIDEEGIDDATLIGSWAGAMGQCQFMPSTFRSYAIDYDGDGYRDIWNSRADVLASIANYVHALGWKADQSWGREVKLTRAIPRAKTGLKRKLTLSEWQALGVRTLRNKPLPAIGISASLVQPDGGKGRAFLVYDNFHVLMRWNRSTYFAVAVGLLADQVGSGNKP